MSEPVVHTFEMSRVELKKRLSEARPTQMEFIKAILSDGFIDENIAPLLKALLTASEEQIRIATAVLRDVYNCGHCSATGDFGDGIERPWPWGEDAGGYPCFSWTQRDKEA